MARNGRRPACHPTLLDFGLGQQIKSAMISDQEPERRSAACAVLQRFLQHQCEEAAEHVTADGLVELVEEREGQ